MGLRHWLREQMLGPDTEGDDVPPTVSLVNTLLGREEERVRSLGERGAAGVPPELQELLRRRSEVSRRLLAIDVTDPEARMAAVPRLRELLRVYPHPLVYEVLILAYLDAGRYDEAKGVVFAARERREECARSEHPEIRAETERLREWSAEEIEALREESEARGGSD